jgi:hypothetical protein
VVTAVRCALRPKSDRACLPVETLR